MITPEFRSLNVVSRTADPTTDTCPKRHDFSRKNLSIRKTCQDISRAFLTEDISIILLKTGADTVEVTFDDKTYSGSATANSILVLPSASHCTISGAAQQSLDMLQLCARNLNSTIEPSLVANDDALNQIIDLAQAILTLSVSKGTYDQIAANLAGLILGHLSAHYSLISFLVPCSQRVDTPKVSSEGNGHIARAVEYMLDHMDRSITLDHVSAAVGRSPGQLARLFKTHLGRTPYRYLLELRIERARTLLATCTMPIAELALECGFANQEHLTRHFRQFSGTTPAVYRRQMSWQNANQASTAPIVRSRQMAEAPALHV